MAKISRCLNTLIITVLLAIAAFSVRAECNFENLPGKKFILRKNSENLSHLTRYISLRKDAEKSTSYIDYKDYVGKKGKINLEKRYAQSSYYYEITIENCEKLYLGAPTRRSPYSSFGLEGIALSSREISFKETIDMLEKQAGKPLWINNTGNKYDHSLYFLDSAKSVKLKNLDRLLLVSIDTTKYREIRYSAGAVLNVRTSSGEIGTIGYNPMNIYFKNPVNKKWKKSYIKAIRGNKVKVGMTKDQALLSWGKPKKINKTISGGGAQEQWVYGKGYYIYFKNGKLNSIQTSSH